MTKTFMITNKTRKLGWGYSCWTKQGDAPNKPDVTGTIREILDYADSDRTYQSYLSGGTYIVEQWFYDGKPIKSAEYPQDTDRLICELGGDSERRMRDNLKVMFA
jgi:hypothetical protein